MLMPKSDRVVDPAAEGTTQLWTIKQVMARLQCGKDLVTPGRVENRGHVIRRAARSPGIQARLPRTRTNGRSQGCDRCSNTTRLAKNSVREPTPPRIGWRNAFGPGAAWIENARI
jgi:hypothetical protein